MYDRKRRCCRTLSGTLPVSGASVPMNWPTLPGSPPPLFTVCWTPAGSRSPSPPSRNCAMAWISRWGSFSPARCLMDGSMSISDIAPCSICYTDFFENDRIAPILPAAIDYTSIIEMKVVEKTRPGTDRSANPLICTTGPNQLPAIHRKERFSDKAGWLNWQDASSGHSFLKRFQTDFLFLDRKDICYGIIAQRMLFLICAERRPCIARAKRPWYKVLPG